MQNYIETLLIRLYRTFQRNMGEQKYPQQYIIYISVALYRTQLLCLCASLNHLSELLIPINLVWNCGMTGRINEVVLTV